MHPTLHYTLNALDMHPTDFLPKFWGHIRGAISAHSSGTRDSTGHDRLPTYHCHNVTGSIGKVHAAKTVGEHKRSQQMAQCDVPSPASDGNDSRRMLWKALQALWLAHWQVSHASPVGDPILTGIGYQNKGRRAHGTVGGPRSGCRARLEQRSTG